MPNHKPLTTRGLARLLLAGPDEPATFEVVDSIKAAAVWAVWCGVPLHPDGRVASISEAGSLTLPRVTVIAYDTTCPFCDLALSHHARCPVTRTVI